MQTLAQIDGKALIVGLGQTGLSCARYLARQGVEFALADSREQPVSAADFEREFPGVDMALGEFVPAMLDGISTLVLSPGVDPRHPVIRQAVADGLDVVGDVELFARIVDAPVVAITGSNGKSTVTELVGEMARCAGINVRVGGNLGTPALDLIDESAELYVMELSSFQLETVRRMQASAAVVLNVSEDHMDRYDSYQDYIAAKAGVYAGCGSAVVNLDDPVVAAMTVGQQAKAFTVLREPAAGEYGLRRVNGKLWLAAADVNLLPANEMKLQGRHNYANALAAIALADAVSLPRAASLQALREFPGLPHRTQWVGEVNSVTYINDSKATNVGATAAAVAGLEQSLVLIAGGIGKEQNFAPLRDVLQGKAKAVVLLGRDAALLEQAIGFACPTYMVSSMQEAVARAAALATAGEAVLLSPACASFDMYSGYAERGEDFVRCVESLKTESTGEGRV